MKVSLDNNRVNESLKFSLRDGIFASAMVGFTQEYFTPFLILLGGTARHVGMLNAFPNLFASLIQLKSADISERLKSRKRVLDIFVLLHALMLLPIAIIALSGGADPAIFITLVVLFTFFGAIPAPAWASLMSDLVGEEKRGEYFGWRNRILGFVIVGTAFIAGAILHLMKKVNAFWGFGIIFALAFIYRMISWHYLRKMYEPPLEYKKEHYFTLFDFFARIRESNFAKFVLFVSMMSFSVNLVSPFFGVLMLRDLHFSYMLYTIVTITATLVFYLIIGRWGRLADRVGNLRIIKFTAPLLSIIPLLWILNRHPVFLIFAQIFGGFLWAGFSLSTSNFIYDAVTPEKRTRCISYFNALNGLALCCGVLMGGILLPWLPRLFGYEILTLCLISSILRIAASVFMLPKLKEVRRSIEKIDNNTLFLSMIGIKAINRY